MPAGSPTPPPDPSRTVIARFLAARQRRLLLIVAVLAVCAVVITRGIHNGEFSFNTDETIHASTGLYFADFLRDLPLRHPMQYTFRYYGQYPALGVLHWPPIFHMFEGLAFFLFGSSVVVARAVIVLFALLGIYFQFRLMEYLESRMAAVVAALLFAFLPLTLLFEKVVMLEIPALSLCIGAIFFWIRYLREERKADIYRFAFFACAALLTKQTGAFLVPVCILTVLFTRRLHIFLQRTTWYVVALCAIVLTPYYLAMARLHGKAMALSVDASHPVTLLHRVTFYWRVLPGQTGWIVLVLSVLGMVTYCAHKEWEKLGFVLAWIAGCYIVWTPIGVMEPRFMIYWLPAWAWLAAVPFTVAARGKVWRAIPPLAAAACLSVQLLSALSFQRPYVSGYCAAARNVVRIAKSGYVLFDGPLPGNFVFFVRTSDPSRRVGVLRKALYVTMISKDEGSEELVHTPQGILNMLSEDGVRYIVVAENSPMSFPVQRTLRDLLHRDHQFRLRGVFPVGGDAPMVKPNMFLAIYENLQAPSAASAPSLHLKMLTTRQDLDVPFTTLGPPPYSFAVSGQ